MILVYTCIAGGYDRLLAPPLAWRREASFVALSDAPLDVDGWEWRPLRSAEPDPCRAAKEPKIRPHRHFPEYEYSIWIDGCIEIIAQKTVNCLVETGLRACDLAVFRHRKRTCAYEEAEACLQAGKDDAETIRRQMNRYRQEGFPTRLGLGECTVILRRHTARVAEFNEQWFREIAGNSRRDQLSFNYTLWRQAVPVEYLPGTIANNEYFRRWPHTVGPKARAEERLVVFTHPAIDDGH